MERVIVTGELSLEGKIRGVPGVLPMVIEAKEQGCKSFILPGENETEGRLVKGIEILPADNLEELCAYLNGAARSEKSKREKKENEKNRQHRAREDFADICGQKAVKRAAEIAVAGGHNLLMAGSPGSGKTMIAKRIATILPELSWEESLEITKIYSVLGLVDQEYPLITQRPFRNVHHTITRTALTGGGRIPMPGEISMAHGGVLFLDELAEFPRNVLEVLRQPLEEHHSYCEKLWEFYISGGIYAGSSNESVSMRKLSGCAEMFLHTRADSEIPWQDQPAVPGSYGYLHRDSESCIPGSGRRTERSGRGRDI